MTTTACHNARASARRLHTQVEQDVLPGSTGERRAAILEALRTLREVEALLTAEGATRAREAVTGQREAVT